MSYPDLPIKYCCIFVVSMRIGKLKILHWLRSWEIIHSVEISMGFIFWKCLYWRSGHTKIKKKIEKLFSLNRRLSLEHSQNLYRTMFMLSFKPLLDWDFIKGFSIIIVSFWQDTCNKDAVYSAVYEIISYTDAKSRVFFHIFGIF